MSEFMKVNQAHWDELVSINAKSAFYDLEGFKNGRSTLDEHELKGVGDVTGKSLLHLQCHFGMDTMSWTRLGASATGVDFSESAIELAHSLAFDLDLDTRFILANVYDLPEQLDWLFDVVFTSHGAICWLPDIKRWAEIVSHFLKPGGRFFIIDGHPFAWTLNDDDASPLSIKYPYFQDPAAPISFETDVSYADPEVKISHTKTYDWNHSISAVVSALIEAGLTVIGLDEYETCVWQYIPQMVEVEPGLWKLPEQYPRFPFRFSVTAVKPLSDPASKQSLPPIG